MSALAPVVPGAPERDEGRGSRSTAIPSSDSSGSEFLSAVTLAADLVRGHVLEPERLQEVVERTVAEAAAIAGANVEVVRRAICLLALRDPRLNDLPPALAAEAVLRILANLAPVRATSLWALDDGREAGRLAGIGDDGIEEPLRAAAEELLAGRTPRLGASGALVAIPVVRGGRTAAALVALAERGEHARVRSLVEEAAAALAVVLERDRLLTRGAARERRLSETGERRLARLALDIHDGPLQDLIALGAEVSELRAQLPALVDDEVESRIAVGRVDDVLARLASLESELRNVSASLEPAGIGRRPLPESLPRQLAAIETRHGVRTTLEIRGDVGETTPSQRIALARIVGEASANAVDHGLARAVDVRVEGGREGIHVEITDDGRGFDVATELASAASRGRLGVVGMSERVRLLGGSFDVESRPGGPTIITVRLPWWRPLSLDSAPHSVPVSA
ncbi:MAG: ATP-binding protein [Actinomycetota bacterium]|nr:ATP-binding protein [Actinomycetota bacterium]